MKHMIAAVRIANRAIFMLLTSFIVNFAFANMQINKECVVPLFSNNEFLTICDDSKKKNLLLLNKDFTIVKKEDIKEKFKPLELIKADNKLYVLSKKDNLLILYRLDETDLKLQKVGSISFGNRDDFILFPNFFENEYFVKNGQIYFRIGLLGKETIPALAIFDPKRKTTGKIVFQKFAGFMPMRLFEFRGDIMLWLRKERKPENSIVVKVKGTEIGYDIFYSGSGSIFSGVSQSKTDKIVLFGNCLEEGFDFCLAEFGKKTDKIEKFSIPLRPLLYFTSENYEVVYGTTVNRSFNPTAYVRCEKKDLSKKLSCKKLDSINSFALPIKVEAEDNKKYFGVYFETEIGTKVYILDENGNIYNSFRLEDKLTPFLSKIFLANGDIYIWNTKNGSSKFMKMPNDSR